MKVNLFAVQQVHSSVPISLYPFEHHITSSVATLAPLYHITTLPFSNVHKPIFTGDPDVDR